jgi:hypothetical protein
VGGYQLAWVGLTDDATDSLRSITWQL